MNTLGKPMAWWPISQWKSGPCLVQMSVLETIPTLQQAQQGGGRDCQVPSVGPSQIHQCSKINRCSGSECSVCHYSGANCSVEEALIRARIFVMDRSGSDTSFRAVLMLVQTLIREDGGSKPGRMSTDLSVCPFCKASPATRDS